MQTRLSSAKIRVSPKATIFKLWLKCTYFNERTKESIDCLQSVESAYDPVKNDNGIDSMSKSSNWHRIDLIRHRIIWGHANLRSIREKERIKREDNNNTACEVLDKAVNVYDETTNDIVLL